LRTLAGCVSRADFTSAELEGGKDVYLAQADSRGTSEVMYRMRVRFGPQDEICVLRAVSRQRDMLVGYQTKHIQHMQKALIADERAAR
jgi:hypothetical protein